MTTDHQTAPKPPTPITTFSLAEWQRLARRQETHAEHSLGTCLVELPDDAVCVLTAGHSGRHVPPTRATQAPGVVA